MSPQAAGRVAATGPWWLHAPHERSRVVDCRCERSLRGKVVPEQAVGEMLANGIQALTRAPSAAAGWRQLLGGARRIVLKFNSVGAEVLGTTRVVGRTLARGLAEAGYDPQDLTLVEAPEGLVEELGARKPVSGWDGAIEVGGRSERVVNYWHQADAVINVPFLKTHQIAGLSGAMKNVSHAVIEHPGLYHAGGCSPYVGQVVSSKLVSAKLRLSVVNALRVVIEGGPDARPGDVYAHGGLLLGCDPVALDAVGLTLLTGVRREVGLRQFINVLYLQAAVEDGVGRGEGGSLEHVVVGDGR